MASRWALLVAELKRRRVLRVAVAYGVAGGGALQLASVVVPALHLPDWTLTAAVLVAGFGFPVAMVLAWTFDFTSAGVVRTPDAVPVPGERRHPGMAALVAAALLVAGAAGGAWWFWLRPPPREASREVVAVLPFTVRGSGQFGYLGEGMVDLLGASLSRGGALHTVDSRSLLRYLRRDAADLDAQRSREVATHFGAGLFVLGDVLEVERRLRIHAALYEVAKAGAPVVEATAEGDAAALFALVDDLLRQLRYGLFGPRAEGPAGRLVHLAEATTSSLPALKAYLEGEKAMRARDWAGAQRAFQRALDDDPSFALAQYRLAVAASWGHDPALVRAAARRAQEARERLSARERKMVAAFSLLAAGRIQKAEAAYRELIAEQPDDVESWYQLGEITFHYGPRKGLTLAEMREPLERALALDPDNPGALTHLADLERADRRRPALAALLARMAASADPQKPSEERWEYAWATGDLAGQRREEERFSAAGAVEAFKHAFGWALWHDDGFEDARRLLDLAARLPQGDHGRRELGMGRAGLVAAQGRMDEAKKLVGDAPVPRRIEMRAAAFTLPFLPATRAQLLDAAEAIRRAGSPPGDERTHLYVLGLLLARAGDPAGIETLAAALEQTKDDDGTSTGHDLALSVRAHLDAWAGRPAEALALLEKMDVQVPYGAKGWPSGVHERMLRARVLRDLGRDAEALRWASTLDTTQADQVLWLAPASLLQAELHERLGAREEAATAYARVVELWKSCDPELRPQVEEARRKLDALRVARR